MLSHAAIGEGLFHAAMLEKVRPGLHLQIEMSPAPPPCGPSRYVRATREEVACVAATYPELEVAAVDGHDAVVVTILLQEFRTEPEERRIGHAVILENDAFLLVFEEPVNGRADRAPASEVLFAEERADIAVPIDRLDGVSDPCTELFLARLTGARAIGGNVDAARRDGPK